MLTTELYLHERRKNIPNTKNCFNVVQLYQNRAVFHVQKTVQPKKVSKTNSGEKNINHFECERNAHTKLKAMREKLLLCKFECFIGMSMKFIIAIKCCETLDRITSCPCVCAHCRIIVLD